VAQIADLIAVEPAEIDAHTPLDSFGLSSREAVSLSGDLEEWLGATLSPTLIYEHPTIAALAAHLSEPGTNAAGINAEAQIPRDAEAPADSSALSTQHSALAIVGIGCRFPGAAGPAAFWRLLHDGVDAISEVPPERWSLDEFYSQQVQPGKMTTRWGGFLERVDEFDARFFGISPREAAPLDPQQRLLLEVAWEALEDAAIAPDSLAGSNSGVFVGISGHDYMLLQGQHGAEVNAYSGSGNAFSIAANRLSYSLDLHGPSVAVDTACSSSLVAVHMALQSLRSGESDLALAGGVNLILSPEATVAFSQARMMAADGRCKTFDSRADGYVRSEGCGLVVLKRLADAERDGDSIYAVIRGSAVNQDGRSNGLTAPNGAAQQAVVRAALQNAAVSPAEVGYVEAHGTGTALGDPIELRALAAVLGVDGRQSSCMLGSVKTNIGHTEAAAGIAGLIKVALAMHHGAIPPHLHLRELNPYLRPETQRPETGDRRPEPIREGREACPELVEGEREGFSTQHAARSTQYPSPSLRAVAVRSPQYAVQNTPFAIPTAVQPWQAGDGLRIAGVSSFGFGGTNAHVVVAESPPDVGQAYMPALRPAATQPQHPVVLPLSAKDTVALRALAGRYAEYLGANPAVRLAEVAATAAHGRNHFAQRLALVASSAAEARERLARLAAGDESAGVQLGQASMRPPKIAFLFTGQGAQYAGMGQQLYASEPVFRAALDRCADILTPLLNIDIREIICEEPRTKNQEPPEPSSENGSQFSVLGSLNQTQFTQPALFALEYALAELWRSWGVRPAVVLGHSVGEYVAACVAGVYSLEDGLRLIAARARLMQELPAGGGMLNVFADAETAAALLAPHAADLSIAAVNGPRHMVLSGRQAALAEVERECAVRGIETRPLTVSHAFHSPLMEPILDSFQEVAENISYRAPTIPLLSNVTGRMMTDAPDGTYWRQHLRQPVQFGANVAALLELGVGTVIEVGPHPALLAMARKNLPEGAMLLLPSLRRNQPDATVIRESVAALYVRGVALDWQTLLPAGPRLRLPTYPFQRERFWFEAGTTTPARAPRHMQVIPIASPLLPLQFAVYATEGQWQAAGADEAARVTALALRLAEAHFGPGDHNLAELTIHAPLAFELDALLLLLDPVTHAVQLCGQREGSWTLHATFELRPGLRRPPEETAETVAATPEADVGTLATLRTELARVLRLAPRQIDPQLSISSLGLDSIMAIELKGTLESRLGVVLPIASLIAGPSLAELADEVERLQAVGASSTAPLAAPTVSGQLSHGQRALWFQHQIHPDSVFNPAYAARVRQPLDVARLRQAFQQVIERHPSLRSRFTMQNGEPMQQLDAQAEIAFFHHDGSGWSEAELQQQLLELSRQPFELETGPLLRLHVLSLADDDHTILMAAHHIVVDLWSQAIIISEVSRCYAEPTLALPPLAQGYADYVAWQNQWLAGPAGEASWRYWQGKLANVAPLELPTDRPRPASQTFTGRTHSFRLPAELTQRLRHLGETQGATLFATTLAAFKLLLYRYTGVADISVGTPTTGRSQTAWLEQVGYFVNPVALRDELDGSQPFTALLGQVRQTVVEAIANQDYPIALLVEKLQPERNLSRTPLFQVMFVFQRAHLLYDEGLSSFAVGSNGNHMALGGLALEGVPLEQQVAPFELTLMLAEAGDKLAASFTYNSDLFEATTIERMVGHFTTLLQAIVATPDQPIGRLPLLTEAETRQLAAWNATARPFDERPVHVQFEEMAARTPTAIAVTDWSGINAEAQRHRDAEDGEIRNVADSATQSSIVNRQSSISYHELNARANQLAHHLRSLGVGPESIVGICLERSPEMIVALLAVLKAGAAYLPLDPGYPAERLRYMVEDARPAVIFTIDDLRLTIGREDVKHVIVNRQSSIVNLTDWQPFAHLPTENLNLEVIGGDLAYVIYTSGSTGRPKGVLLQHRGLSNLVQAQISGFGITAASRVLQFASFSFDAAVSEVFMALLAGGTLYLLDRDTLTTPQELARAMHELAISAVTLPPSLLALLPPEELPGLQTVISAGERCGPELAERWRVGRRFFNAYGPTEATIGPTFYEVTGALPEGVSSTPIGTPIANMQIHLLDSYGQPVPVGVPGEIHIGGVGLARGYLNRPELTAERFINLRLTIDDLRLEGSVPAQSSIVNRQSLIYKTGDLARRLPDGTLEYMGRIDQQVKLRGFRIELGEIETVLKQHPGVRDAVALVREDTPGDQRLIAYVVPENRKPVKLWPSVAEYFIYDDLLYSAMTNDERRNSSYRNAIRRAVPGKVVVEVGTGKDAILARICVEEGARHVYAIELLEESYQKAKACIESLGLSDRITLIHGDMRSVTLPELADVCVSELVGPIGGCEGAALLINDAWRFLKPGGVMIPSRTVTQIAAVQLPDAFVAEPHFSAVSGCYVERIFEHQGYRFDLRLCMQGLGREALRSSVGVFEDLDHTGPAEAEYIRHEQLHVVQNGRVDGFLVWLQLHTDADNTIDILDHEHCWLPVFLPVFSPGIQAEAGDVFDITIESRLSDNGLNPDYHLSGVLQRADGSSLPWNYSSYHYKQLYQATPFYAQLFANDAVPTRADEQVQLAPSELRANLRQRMPEYMVPAGFMFLDALPLTPNGKVDRKGLPAPKSARPAGPTMLVAPRNATEQVLATIWQAALKLEQVGVHDNFFDLGGHSLLMAKVHSQVQEQFGRNISLVELFRRPTISALASYLSGDSSEQRALQESQERAQKQRSALQQRQQNAALARQRLTDKGKK
jgi:amino acid adenylation domain-containing protein